MPQVFQRHAENPIIRPDALSPVSGGALWRGTRISCTCRPTTGDTATVWDGGHRVPFFASWPGVIAAGSMCAEPICLTDLLKTAAEIVETPLPANAGEDSVSMMPLFRGQTANNPRAGIIHHSVNGTFGIRSGNWKLLTCRGSGGWSVPEDDAREAPAMQLYNVIEDPAEEHNCFESQPEKARELPHLLEQYQAAGRSAPTE